MVVARRGDRTPKPCTHDGKHRHGTKVAYQKDRCRCDPCTEAAVRYDRNRRRKIAYGQWDPRPWLVDATEAREHLRKLAARGMGEARIAELSGLSHHPLRTIKQGAPRAHEATVAAILSIPLDAPVAPGTRLDATGTKRRVQALACMGWSLERIGREAGIYGRGNMFALLIFHDKVTARVERAVREVYERLWDKEPTWSNISQKGVVTRTKNLAKKRGWAPPLAWDEETIDDPEAKPNWGPPPKKYPRNGNRHVVTNEVIEDLEWLRASGVLADVAAERVGFTLKALRMAVRYKGYDVNSPLATWLRMEDERNIAS